MEINMAFIDTIPDSEINADVRAMYERQQSFRGVDGAVVIAPVLRAHVDRRIADERPGGERVEFGAVIVREEDVVAHEGKTARAGLERPCEG